MGFEQLALVGLGIGGAFALLTLVMTWRVTAQSKRLASPRRFKRLIGTEEGARSAARSIAEELVRNHPDDVEHARRTLETRPALEAAIDDARTYFLGRVDARHKPLFHDVVDELVFGKPPRA